MKTKTSKQIKLGKTSKSTKKHWIAITGETKNLMATLIRKNVRGHYFETFDKVLNFVASKQKRMVRSVIKDICKKNKITPIVHHYKPRKVTNTKTASASA